MLLLFGKFLGIPQQKLMILKGDKTDFKDLVNLKVLWKGNTILFTRPQMDNSSPRSFPANISFCLLTKKRFSHSIQNRIKDVIIEVCLIIETLKTLNGLAIHLLIRLLLLRCVKFPTRKNWYVWELLVCVFCVLCVVCLCVSLCMWRHCGQNCAPVSDLILDRFRWVPTLTDDKSRTNYPF